MAGASMAATVVLKVHSKSSPSSGRGTWRVRGTSRQLSIGTVADRYGVPATTLRYWEQIGLLPAQERTAGQRRYDRDALRRIKFIRMAKQAGLALEDIKALLAGHVDHSPTFIDWATAARDQLVSLDQRITDLEHLKTTIEGCLTCGCQHAQRCKLLTVPNQADRPHRTRKEASV